MNAGFSLVEVLVAVGIISIIMTVALTGNGSFNRSILLGQAAQMVASSIREAQSLGIANRGINSNAGYGFHIAYDGDIIDSYLIFTDTYPGIGSSEYWYDSCYATQDPSLPSAKPGNCRYNPGENELVKTYELVSGFRISQFCGTYYDDGGTTCANLDAGEVDAIDAVFSRPNTDAVISVSNGDGDPARLSFITLYLEDKNGAQRCVMLRDTGQVSVPQECP